MIDLIYIFIIFWAVFFVFMGFFYCKQNRIVFYFFAFFPIIISSWYRGSAGTDTENYINHYEYFDLDEFSIFSIDPIYSILVYFSKLAGVDFFAFSVIHSILCLVFSVSGASRIDKNFPIIGLTVLPVFLIDATFNGLRYGLAFSIMLYFFSIFLEKKTLLRRIFLLIPAFVHFSSIFIFIINSLDKFNKSSLFTFVLLFCVTYFLWAEGILSFFQYKIESYSLIEKPSGFSGFSYVFAMIIYFLSNRLDGKYRYVNSYCNIGFIIAFVISFYSYAGLRFMQVFLFITAMSVSFFVNKKNFEVKIFLFIVLSLFNIINFLRQIYFVGVSGGVKFLPYGI